MASEADKLRRALVHAVRIIHPRLKADIAADLPFCVAFLSQFETIFTLNYDLLLYWVMLEDSRRFTDGFGLAEERDGFRWPFKADAHCNVFNVHGGLHLFETNEYMVEKRIDQGHGLIDAIASSIVDHRRMPLYVAEGTSAQKLARIYAVPYLRHCYEELQMAENSFFVFGHSVSANDAHIYDALFRSDIDHLYFCVHRPTADVDEVNGELSRYQKRNNSAVEYTFVDAESVTVWG